MNDKFIQMLGLCRRSGNILFGYDRAKKAVIAQRTQLVLTASDFSVRSFEKLSCLCKEKNIPILKLSHTTDELYFLLSYRAGVLAVTDKGFAERIKQLLQNEIKEDFAI